MDAKCPRADMKKLRTPRQLKEEIEGRGLNKTETEHKKKKKSKTKAK